MEPARSDDSEDGSKGDIEASKAFYQKLLYRTNEK
jgi:hypothetical protein